MCLRAGGGGEGLGGRGRRGAQCAREGPRSTHRPRDAVEAPAELVD